jgi:hypothetical protein
MRVSVPRGPVARLLGLDQAGQDVVARLRALARDQRAHELPDRAQVPEHGAHDPESAEAGREHAQTVSEAFGIVLRHPDPLGDHAGGQRPRISGEGSISRSFWSWSSSSFA